MIIKIKKILFSLKEHSLLDAHYTLGHQGSVSMVILKMPLSFSLDGERDKGSA